MNYFNFTGRARRSEYWWFQFCFYLSLYIPVRVFGPFHDASLGEILDALRVDVSLIASSILHLELLTGPKIQFHYDDQPIVLLD